MDLHLYALALEQHERARQQAANRRAARHHEPGRPTARRGVTRWRGRT
jgi:hypothetical protein